MTKQYITREELENNPELLEAALDYEMNPDNWHAVTSYIESQRNVPFEFIEKHYKTAKSLGYIHGARYMVFTYKAHKEKELPIHKTMTQFELFESGSRKWALPFSSLESIRIKNLANLAKQKKKNVNIIEPLLNPNQTEKEFDTLYGQLFDEIYFGK